MRKLVILCFVMTIAIKVTAQEGFGTANPNKDAVIDLVSANKGLLLPRVALTATNVAAPLSAMVAGMSVYNTVSAGSGNTGVTPGVYFNDGTKWVRFYDNAMLPWNNVVTQTAATNEVQDIYQSGNVAIGTGGAAAFSNRLFVKAAATVDPIRTEGLQASPNTTAEKIMVSNPTTGVVNWINFSSIKTGSYRVSSSQTLTKACVGPGLTVDVPKDPLLFTASDAVSVPSFMTIVGNGVFSITDGGLYDIFVGASLSVSTRDDYVRAQNVYEHMAVNLNLERLDGATWVPIANTRTTLDTRAGVSGSSGVMSLTPLNVAIRLNTGDQIRFIVQRATGNYLIQAITTQPMQLIADATKGVPFSKTLRMVRLQ